MSGKPARWREWNPWSPATCCWPSILISPPEVRLYLARQAWEEANHAMAFEYVIKTLPVDRERVLGLEEHPAVAAKAAFQRRLTAEILRPDLDLATIEGRQRLLRNLVGSRPPGGIQAIIPLRWPLMGQPVPNDAESPSLCVVHPPGASQAIAPSA
jgi:hypothetical protein